MSTRLQVVVSEEEAERYRDLAKARGMTLSEWVRQELRAAARGVSLVDPARKLAALRKAVSLSLDPAPDVETMLAEIESGYLASPASAEPPADAA